jgi:hypothetical protein
MGNAGKYQLSCKTLSAYQLVTISENPFLIPKLFPENWTFFAVNTILKAILQAKN